MNKLYVASVPIGNLKETTQLLLEVFEKIKVIFCEDTRTTSSLMQKLGIKNKPKLISCHKYNENTRFENILKEVKLNDVLLVSDAGYPTISDPGNFTISKLIQHNIDIEVINGPAAFVHALVKSGFSTSKFSFLGFLDNRKNQQIKLLEKYRNLESTIIIYESVHRLINTIRNIKDVFQNNIICVCKELTKKYETFWYGKPNEIIDSLNSDNLKGEFVILIDNNHILNNENEQENWKSKIDLIRNYNLSNKDILEIIENFYPNIPKKSIYNYILGKEDAKKL